MRPNDVNKKNEPLLLSSVCANIQSRKMKQPKFKPNDIVRVSKHKGVFSKGYYPNWSTELFKIHHVQPTDPITYLLKDEKGEPILGTFYSEELQKTKHPDVYLVEKVLKRKGNKVLVK